MFALVFVSMNKFTIRYPNGIKRHINKSELAILSDSLQQIGPHEYRAASLQHTIEQSSQPSFLAGTFIFELKGKKRRELMQSVSGMVRELQL